MLKPITYRTPISSRVGHPETPIYPGDKQSKMGMYGWVGWLSYGEYDFLEVYNRTKATKAEQCCRGDKDVPTMQRYFNTLKNNELVTGTPLDFKVTKLALELFDKTEEFILSLDLSEDGLAKNVSDESSETS